MVDLTRYSWLLAVRAEEWPVSLIEKPTELFGASGLCVEVSELRHEKFPIASALDRMTLAQLRLVAGILRNAKEKIQEN